MTERFRKPNLWHPGPYSSLPPGRRKRILKASHPPEISFLIPRGSRAPSSAVTACPAAQARRVYDAGFDRGGAAKRPNMGVVQGAGI